MQAKLKDYVRVKGRFHRSIHLTRDFAEVRAPEDYLLTPTARNLTLRMLEVTRDPKAPRAWSITGPYGTGKSAFALFLSNVLGGKTKRGSPIRRFRREQNIRSKPFVCTLVIGRREPISKTIMVSLAETIKHWRVKPTLARRIRMASTASTQDSQQILSVFEELCDSIEKMDLGGLLVIIDEFGKFLEYATLHPEDDDIHIMQGLAEIAARSKVPFLLLTILHTAFASYLPIADHVRRAEWAKVQGRFQDVVFLEPASQMLALIGEALDLRFPSELTQKYNSACKRILKSKAFSDVRERIEIDDLVPSCIPLHPIVATLLWPIFRSQLAQNERSLFSFLTVNEPFSFQDFLAQTPADGKPHLYTTDWLYDYITSTLGSATYQGMYTRRWAELVEALDRVGADAPALVPKVLKTLGLIMLHGNAVGLKADEKTLAGALGKGKAVHTAIEYLTKNSIVVYRNHQSAYGLWEGSDVDVEERYRTGVSKVEGADLVSLVREALELMPMVARAHYSETGTLRAFDVEVIEGREDMMLQSVGDELRVRDGRLIYILASSTRIKRKLIEIAKELTAQPTNGMNRPIIFAFPKPMAGLEHALIEVEAWKWVAQNTPALEGDRPARTEIASRLAFAKERLGTIAGEVYGLRGHVLHPQLSSWVYRGEELRFSSSQEFLRWLSQLCNEVYSEAPAIKNELINRDHLSSAAAAARNNLMKAMLRFEGADRLGIEGTPPEISMYETLLHKSGFHCFRRGQYDLREPKGDWKPVWKAVKSFLGTTRKCRRPVQELYSQLKAPPFGLREGPLPILVLLVLLMYPERVALYTKEGVLIPEIREEVLELLVRNPGDFEIQQISINRSKKEMLIKTARVLEKQGVGTSIKSTVLLDVVKPLVVFIARLPQYTRNTKNLDAYTVALREVLLKAKDPHQLLFKDIPRALGLEQDRTIDSEVLTKRLGRAIQQLNRAYARLLDEIEQELRAALALNGSSTEAQKTLRERAEVVVPFAAEQTLALFAREATRIKDRNWREVLGRVVQKGLPPDRWTDHDAIEFQMRLQQLRSDFLRLEELVAEKGELPSGQIVRVGLLDGRYEETREVVSIPPGLESAVESLQRRIIDCLDQGDTGSDNTESIRLAALARAVAEEIERRQREASG